jgi:hypothetical protein
MVRGPLVELLGKYHHLLEWRPINARAEQYEYPDGPSQPYSMAVVLTSNINYDAEQIAQRIAELIDHRLTPFTSLQRLKSSDEEDDGAGGPRRTHANHEQAHYQTPA